MQTNANKWQRQNMCRRRRSRNKNKIYYQIKQNKTKIYVLANHHFHSWHAFVFFQTLYFYLWSHHDQTTRTATTRAWLFEWIEAIPCELVLLSCNYHVEEASSHQSWMNDLQQKLFFSSYLRVEFHDNARHQSRRQQKTMQTIVPIQLQRSNDLHVHNICSCNQSSTTVVYIKIQWKRSERQVLKIIIELEIK